MVRSDISEIENKNILEKNHKTKFVSLKRSIK